MTESAPKDWDDEDKIYTKIRNLQKNGKIVLSTLEGIELAPMQDLDLRTRFRKAQLADASHEIFSLIQSGHLKDISDGADERAEANKPESTKVQDEMKKKMVENLIREISGSSAMSQLEDWMSHREPEVAKAAKIRLEQLQGLRDDNGDVIPGAEEEVGGAKPTVAGGVNPTVG